MYTLTVEGTKRQYPEGTTFEDVAAAYQDKYDGQIALVAADGKIRELFKPVEQDCEVTFFTLKDDVGHKTYVRTATMMLVKAIEDVAGKELAGSIKVEFAIGRGYYVHSTENHLIQNLLTRLYL